MSLLISYLAVVNFFTWLVYGIDKRRARKGKWRVTERTLLTLAFIGGSAGAAAGMMMFRHKTKKLKFLVGIPVMLAAHCVIVGALIGRLAG